jgi:phosphoribosylformylglycinamidine synthase
MNDIDHNAPWREHGLTEEEYSLIARLMDRAPNQVELAMFGVMWSEHCSYKNSKAQLRKFPTSGPQVLEGPGENAGVADVGDGWGLAFKIESHNHPSAIDPYNGAATGVGGIVRDIFAMGARPIAALNSLRFGGLDNDRTRALLKGAVAGIADYGNGLGLPTVGGEIYFHPSYQENPLVGAMCVGLVRADRIFKGAAAGIGNQVLVAGARTGRDGVKGASFASEELADSGQKPRTPVGDPLLEKRLLEATLEVLDQGLVVGLQDLGAAGLTSSGAEMAGRAGNGLYIDVDKVPLGEEGLAPWEIMLSETQERMLLVAHPDKVDEIKKVFNKWDLTVAAIGEVTGDGFFTVRRGEETLARVSADLLTDRAPVNIRPVREPGYFKERKKADFQAVMNYGDWGGLLMRLLASPNLSCRSWIYERFDYLAGRNTIVSPGGDAAVLRLPASPRGLALTCDCNSRYVYLNPRLGGAIAVAEAARNLAAVGARPLALTNCLNFGNPENPEIYWQFVQATDGLAEAARALDTPVTGGNVSFYNEYNGRAIFPTPTIGMVGLLDDLDDRVTIAFKAPGDLVFLAGETREELGASEVHHLLTGRDEGEVPALDLGAARRLNDFLVEAAKHRLLRSAHDCAEGGLAVALAESALAGGLGVELDFDLGLSPAATFFGESQSRAVLSARAEEAEELAGLALRFGLPLIRLGSAGGENFRLNAAGAVLSVPLAEMARPHQDGLAALAGLV